MPPRIHVYPPAAVRRSSSAARCTSGGRCLTRGVLRSRTRIFLRIEQVYQPGLGSIRFSVEPLLRWLKCNRSLGGGLGDYVLIVRAIYKWTRYGHGAAI